MWWWVRVVVEWQHCTRCDQHCNHKTPHTQPHPPRLDALEAEAAQHQAALLQLLEEEPSQGPPCKGPPRARKGKKKQRDCGKNGAVAVAVEDVEDGAEVDPRHPNDTGHGQDTASPVSVVDGDGDEGLEVVSGDATTASAGEDEGDGPDDDDAWQVGGVLFQHMDSNASFIL